MCVHVRADKMTGTGVRGTQKQVIRWDFKDILKSLICNTSKQPNKRSIQSEIKTREFNEFAG